jgi:hypothetical protein
MAFTPRSGQHLGLLKNDSLVGGFETLEEGIDSEECLWTDPHEIKLPALLTR